MGGDRLVLAKVIEKKSNRTAKTSSAAGGVAERVGMAKQANPGSDRKAVLTRTLEALHAECKATKSPERRSALLARIARFERQ